MNDESTDDELDLGVEATPAPWKKILLITLGAVLLLAIGGGGAYFLFSPSEEKSENEEVKTEEQVVTEDEDEDEDVGSAFYRDLTPVFVVNLAPGGKAKMLQIGVQVLTRDEDLFEFMGENDPMIRHSLLKLFGARKSSDLRSRAGKEKLQVDVQAEVQKIIEEQGNSGIVEAVFFTSFVMQ